MRKYSSPRYKQPTRPGRKPLPKDKRRKLIAARVSPNTFQYFSSQNVRLGALLDQLVKKELRPPNENSSANDQSIDFDAPEFLNDDSCDLVTEQARGLLALIVERGTDHLTQEQIEMLSDNFTLIVNNFTATFKKR